MYCLDIFAFTNLNVYIFRNKNNCKNLKNLNFSKITRTRRPFRIQKKSSKIHRSTNKNLFTSIEISIFDQ